MEKKYTQPTFTGGEENRMERVSELLLKETTQEELQQIEKDKQEKEEKRLEKIKQQELKNKSMVSYQKFMNLENNWNKFGVTQILIVRDEIYINKLLHFYFYRI